MPILDILGLKYGYYTGFVDHVLDVKPLKTAQNMATTLVWRASFVAKHAKTA